MNENSHDATNDQQSCVYHEQRVACATCAMCDAFLCLDCIHRTTDGLSLCAGCDTSAEARSNPSFEAPSSLTDDALSVRHHTGPSEPLKPRVDSTETSSVENELVGTEHRITIPWEDQHWRGDTSAFFKTLASAFQSPTVYMNSVPWSGRSLGPPLIFGLLVATLGHVAQIGYQLLSPEQVQRSLQNIPGLTVQNPLSLVFATLPMIPIVFVVSLLLQSWVSHALLKLFGAARHPYAATFRVHAYSQAAAILLFLPGFGVLAAKFYMIFLAMTGFRLAHGAGVGASILAVMPMIFLQGAASFG